METLTKYIPAPSVFRELPHYHGWVVEVHMMHEVKKDGTPNRGCRDHPTGVQIHRHYHGHVRIYEDGNLKYERYYKDGVLAHEECYTDGAQAYEHYIVDRSTTRRRSAARWI